MPEKSFLKKRESGLKLNKTKCQIRLIVFLGRVICQMVLKLTPYKTEAAAKMPLPGSVNELQKFLGMVNCLGKFVLNFAEHTTLLKKDVVFELQKSQLDSIEKLKNLSNISTLSKDFRLKITNSFKI